MFPLELATSAVIVGASLVVQTTSPDALCPDLGSARQAVADRLGSLEVDAEGWVASYVVVRTSGGRGDHLRLELRDPEQGVRLVREIPLDPGACPTMAVAIALVLERFFADLTAMDPMEEDRPAEPAAVRPSSSSMVETPAAVPPGASPARSTSPIAEPGVTEQTSRSSAVRRSWRSSLGSAFGAGFSNVDADLRPEAGVVVRAAGPLHLELGLLGTFSWRAREETGQVEDPRQVSPPQNVEYRAFAQSLRLFSHYGVGDRGWSLSLGPEVLIGLEWASAEPSSVDGPKGRVLPGLGAGYAFRWRLGSLLSLGFLGSVDWIPTGKVRRFFFVGQEVLRPRRVSGFLGVTLEFAPGQ